MSASSIKQVACDEDYEQMVEDIIGNFNHIVTQGITPMKALYAMASAFGIVLGCCIRGGMKKREAVKLISMIMNNADASEQMVRIITKN